MPTRRHVAVLVPGALTTRTGGSIYDARIVGGLRGRGWTVDVREVDPSFPSPTAAALDQAAEELRRLPDGTIAVIDGLLFGAMPDAAQREAARLRLVALVHLPLAMAVGLDRERAAALERSETGALRAATRVIATGNATVAAMKRYGVPEARVVLVEPGVDVAAAARGSQGDSVELLCVANVVHGKGHAVLIEALAGIADRRWRLTCAGSLDRDRAAAERLRAQVRAHQLEDRVALVGELDQRALDEHYARADVFVLPTLFESYGMAVAEALAHGLPVIATHTGAIPDLVGDLAGLIVAPGDRLALQGALALVMDDRQVRRRFTAGARRVRSRLRTWDAAVTDFARVLEGVAAGA